MSLSLKGGEEPVMQEFVAGSIACTKVQRDNREANVTRVVRQGRE